MNIKEIATKLNNGDCEALYVATEEQIETLIEQGKIWTIVVEVKQQYGNEVIHPACDPSRLFAQLAGTVTLTAETRAIIKQLGYSIAVVAPTYNL